MLLTTHEMDFARDVADVICFLHEGVILEKGPPAEVLDSPRDDHTKVFLSRIGRHAA